MAEVRKATRREIALARGYAGSGAVDLAHCSLAVAIRAELRAADKAALVACAAELGLDVTGPCPVVER